LLAGVGQLAVLVLLEAQAREQQEPEAADQHWEAGLGFVTGADYKPHSYRDCHLTQGRSGSLSFMLH
jgi:hypothetical protein